MEGLRAWPKPPGDAPVALRWLFAERHVTAQLPLGEPRGWLKNKRPWESGHTVYKPYLAEPLVLILGRAPSRSLLRVIPCQLKELHGEVRGDQALDQGVQSVL